MATPVKAGARSRISPIPGCCCRSSVNEPWGQPPPGNCAERVGQPVSQQRASARASWEARQSEGCSSSRAAGDRESMMSSGLLYKRTVPACALFGKVRYQARPASGRSASSVFAHICVNIRCLAPFGKWWPGRVAALAASRAATERGCASPGRASRFSRTRFRVRENAPAVPSISKVRLNAQLCS